MLWNAYKSIILRASDSDDPTAEGHVEQEIGVFGIKPYRRDDGFLREFASTRIRRVKIQRWCFDVAAKPFKVRVGDGDAYQNVSVYYNVVGNLMTKRNLWLYACRSAANTAVLPRASGDDAEEFWNASTDDPAGLLPMLVEIEDGFPAPEPNFGAGTEKLNFTLTAVDTLL